MDLLPFITHLLSLRDPNAKDHSSHVNELASRLAREIELPAKDVEQIGFGAAIHDIGKVAINDFIVNKPGRYTEAEFLMVQQHALLGARMLAKLELEAVIPAMVLQHHENFDGTGYPYGLHGDAISLGARILRITDTYDALTTDRGYRPAYEPARALEIMEAESQFFDPDLLQAFLKMDGKSSA